MVALPHSFSRPGARLRALMIVALSLPAASPTGWAQSVPQTDDYGFEQLAPGLSWEPAPDPALAIPSLVAPEIDRSAAFQKRSALSGLARPEIRATTIRRGLSTGAAPGASPERAVGLKLEPARFALSTAFVSGDGSWSSAGTRFDWNLTRGTSAKEGLQWNTATGGGVGFTGGAEQHASASLGYRRTLFDRLTVTSQVAVETRYEFAAANLAEAVVTPEFQILADLTQPMATPWRTVVDVKLQRRIPLAGGERENAARAMLRLDYRPD